MSIVRKWGAALAGGARRARVQRRAELSSLGMERLEGRALQSQLAHLTPVEIATIHADREAHRAEHHHEIHAAGEHHTIEHLHK